MHPPPLLAVALVTSRLLRSSVVCIELIDLQILNIFSLNGSETEKVAQNGKRARSRVVDHVFMNHVGCKLKLSATSLHFFKFYYCLANS